jgi:hypothetical protein
MASAREAPNSGTGHVPATEVVVHQRSSSTIIGDAAPFKPPKEKPVSYMSLPNKGQLAILCIARLADPLANTSISVRLTGEFDRTN